MSKCKFILSSLGRLGTAMGLGASLAVVPLVALAQGADRVEVAVGHKAGAAAAVRAEVVRNGGRVVHDLAEVDAMVVVLPRAAVSALAKNSRVDFVESGVPRSVQGGRVAKDTKAAGQVVPYGITMVQANQVSDAYAGSRTVCIVDSGIDGSHEDLAGIPMTGSNFTRSGSWNTDENSHGTHVAGTIAALNNSVGVVGVAPSGTLRLHIGKVFDASGSASSVVISRAMLDCWRNGAQVVSMSLGGSAASPMEARVAALLFSKGVLQIAAAGNLGNNTVSYPAGFAQVMSVAAIDENKAKASFSQFNPDVEIAAPGVGVLSTVPAWSQTGASLSVGAATYPVLPMEDSPRKSASGVLASMGQGLTATPGSMTGKVCLIQRGGETFANKVLNCQNSGGVAAVVYNNVDGPLSGTLSGAVTTIPSVGASKADGEAMLASGIGQASTVSVFGLPDLYAAYDGTSMATPHVSGVAAVVWSLNPGCTAEQLRASLNKTAMDLGAAGRDVNFGYGLVQAKAAHQRIVSQGCGN